MMKTVVSITTLVFKFKVEKVSCVVSDICFINFCRLYGITEFGDHGPAQIQRMKLIHEFTLVTLVLQVSSINFIIAVMFLIQFSLKICTSRFHLNAIA